MLDSEAQKVTPPNIVPRESVTEEQTAEEQDDDYRGESQQAEPVRPEPSTHFVDIYAMLGRGWWLNLAVSGEDCSSPSIINALIDRSRESIPLV
tara:strand:+ start:362 stop:643 length:282 start_codon:yes stop_codon:yes gene_type:complete